MDASLNALLPFVALLLLSGAISGLLAGVFGVGGGAILVPVLYQMFELAGVPADVRMHLAVGTSLAIIIPTSIQSYRKHKAKGAVDLATLKVWAIPTVVGVLAGSAMAAYAPSAVLKGAFVLVASVTAVKLLSGRDDWTLAQVMPARPLMRVLGLGIGLLSALMGIGGGMIGNLLQTLYGVPIHRAVATSSGLGVLISIPGTVGYILGGLPKLAALPPLSIGYVSAIAFIIVAPLATYMTPFGVKFAHAISKRQLEIAFGLFLVLVSARFVASLIWP